MLTIPRVERTEFKLVGVDSPLALMERLLCFTGSLVMVLDLIAIVHSPTQPTGDNSYSQQINSSNIWCHGFNSDPCFVSEDNSNIGLSSASHVAAYGETDDTDAQIGDRSPYATYLSAIQYKPTLNASQFNYIQTSGSQYAGCGASPCPYGYGIGFSASNLYVYNYTS